MTKFLRFCLAVMIFEATISRAENPFGFDSGHTPENAIRLYDDLGLTGRHGTWIRLRNMSGSPVIGLHAEGADHIGEVINSGITVSSRRKALIQLRHRGFRFAAMLRWSNASWNDGVRVGKGDRLPLNLSEPYERCRALARTYGDLVDYWEIENEPDLGFVDESAETFAAFFKACSLGIRAGNNDRLARSESVVAVDGMPPETSLVMASPMALPPGPYWEQLIANDYLAYVDAFNYHFYGYAEDFGPVRDRWRDALDVAGYAHLPMFLTEYGYGLLDRADSFSVDGRENQREWFQKVAPFISDGEIRGAMAFYLPPYYPRLTHEFGLLANLSPNFESGNNPRWAAPQSNTASKDSPAGITVDSENTAPSVVSPENSTQRETIETDLIPVVVDFIPETDTRQIKRYNSYMATGGKPEARTNEFTLKLVRVDGEPLPPGRWTATLEAGSLETVSPSGPALTTTANKESTTSTGRSGEDSSSASIPPPRPTLRSNLRPAGEADWPTEATPVVTTRGKSYAISPALEFLTRISMVHELAPNAPSIDDAKEASPVPSLPATLQDPARPPFQIAIPAVPSDARMERHHLETSTWKRPAIHTVRLRASIPYESTGGNLYVEFRPDDGSRPLVLSTRLIPALKGRETEVVDRFDFPADAACENRHLLLNRPLASEESQLNPDGRWLATTGTSVEEIPTGWRITVTELPPEPLRPAVVELPLPDQWTFPSSGSFLCSYRLVTDESQRTEECDSYFRTTTGNLYQVWPRWNAKQQYQTSLERAGNYTLAFFGRAESPSRFEQQIPASLVFMFRPRTLPAVFEINAPRIIQPKTNSLPSNHEKQP